MAKLLINYNKAVILQFKMAEEPAKQKNSLQTVSEAHSNRPNQSTEMKLSGGPVKSTDAECNGGPRIEKRVSFEADAESVKQATEGVTVKADVD